jgi:hypothetical protein
MTDDWKDFFAEFISNELPQIKISQYIVHFAFVEGPEISVESSFEHIGKDGRTLSRFEIYGPRKEVTVHALLGAKIVNADIDFDENFLITFDHGDSIRFFCDRTMSESYAICLTSRMRSTLRENITSAIQRDRRKNGPRRKCDNGH